MIAKAPDYQTEELTLLPGRDTTLDFGTMKQLPGRLRISAFSAGGLAWHDMNVFVDGIAGTFAVDHWIELPPNTYHVRLERVWPTDIYYAGPFAIQIRARKARDCRVEYQVRAVNTPTPAQGGGTPCAQ